MLKAEASSNGTYDSCSFQSVVDCPHHPSLLELGLCIDTSAPNIYVLLLVIVVFSVIVELFLHQLDHFAEHNKSYAPVLNSVYRELVLLGILSFGLYLAETTEWCALRRSLDVESFEFAHYLIFFLSVFYIFTVLVLLLLVRRSYTKWKSTQSTHPSELKGRLDSARQHLEAIPWWHLSSRAFALHRYVQTNESYTFVLMRTTFIMLHHEGIFKAAQQAFRRAHIPQSQQPTKDEILLAFDFVRYLRKCTRHLLLKLLQISRSIVILVLFILIVQIIRLSISGGSVSLGVPIFVFVCGYAVIPPFFLLLYFALRYRLKRYKRMVLQSEVEVMPYVNKFDTYKSTNAGSMVVPTVPFTFPKLPSFAPRPQVRMSDDLTTALNSADHFYEPQERTISSRQRTGSFASQVLFLRSINAWNVLSPNTYFSLMQVLMYWSCFYMAVVLLYVQIQIKETEENNAGVTIVAWLPAVFVYVFALPQVLPKYTILLCVGTVPVKEQLVLCFQGVYCKGVKADARKALTEQGKTEDLEEMGEEGESDDDQEGSDDESGM